MFRTAVLTAVLMFWAGPQIAMLCDVWCLARKTADAGCHHEHSSSAARIGGTDLCQEAPGAPALKEDVRRHDPAGKHPAVCAAPLAARPGYSKLAFTIQVKARPPGLTPPLDTPLRL